MHKLVVVCYADHNIQQKISDYFFRRLLLGGSVGDSSLDCTASELSMIFVMSQRGWLLSACQ